MLRGNPVPRALLLGHPTAFTVLHRSCLAGAVLRRSGLASFPLLGDGAAEDVRVRVLVGVEGRDIHEQEQDDSARERDR